MQYWLVKSEPDAYSWEDFVAKGRDHWDGVRNYAARNHLRGMSIGDLVLFYHSNKAKEVVGIAKVVKENYQDPTTEDERWSVVDLEPVRKLKKTITLKDIKDDPKLQGISLLKQSRLSVHSLSKEVFDQILSKEDL